MKAKCFFCNNELGMEKCEDGYYYIPEFKDKTMRFFLRTKFISNDNPFPNIWLCHVCARKYIAEDNLNFKMIMSKKGL